MSKSKKNVVDPNDIIKLYGADTARWFMLSDSPPERDLQWTDKGIVASFKFINRLYDFILKYKEFKSVKVDDLETVSTLKEIINEVSKNIDNFQFNKSVAKIYEFVNILNEALTKKRLTKENFGWSLKKLSIILQPFVPHISEEIWSGLGENTLCIEEVWPIESVERKVNLNLALQINGKTKEIIEIDKNLKEEEVIKIAKIIIKLKKYFR